MQNLKPNNNKFASWTPTATGSATSPTGTYSATSGPDSTPGLTLAATGTSGGVEAVTTVPVAAESMLGVSVVLNASSASANCTPIQVTFKDASGNTVLTATPYADAAAVAAVTQYNAVVGVPDGAVSAVVTLGFLHWSATGGYTTVLSSPIVEGF